MLLCHCNTPLHNLITNPNDSRCIHQYSIGHDGGHGGHFNKDSELGVSSPLLEHQSDSVSKSLTECVLNWLFSWEFLRRLGQIVCSTQDRWPTNFGRLCWNNMFMLLCTCRYISILDTCIFVVADSNGTCHTYASRSYAYIYDDILGHA